MPGVAEGLPWLAMTYVDMDWDWLVRNAKVRDRQNRLGFAVSLAGDVAEGKNDMERARELRQYLKVLEGARLAREDTFCHDSMTQAERAWLREHRSPAAAHWNLLTDMKGEHLTYASEQKRPGTMAFILLANWIRRCARKLGWIVWGDLSSPWCTDFRGQREIWTYWKLHRGMLADPC